jgi:hypothetical protein
MKLKTFFLSVLIAWPFMMAMAEGEVNMKFGKPTKEEMEMLSYEADPMAEAVVLCRLTDVEYIIQENGYLVDYHEKYRIKVLKPGGARYAKVVIPYMMNTSHGSNLGGLRFSMFANQLSAGSGSTEYGFDAGSMTTEAMGDYSDESVEDLKATAFNLRGGKVVKSVLKKSDIVKTEIDEHHHQVSFTIPDVEVGTVIEYEYTIHSELFWLLHDWFAQCEIPVVYAKLDMNIPSYLQFNVEEHGIQRLKCTCTNGVVRYKLISDPMANPVSAVSNHYICVGRDLMAMHKDNYVYCVQDYCAGVTAELKRYKLRGTMMMDYARTWEQIDRMILEDEDLGKQLDDHSPLRDLLQEKKIKDIADKNERAIAVYQLVMSKVKWDGTYKLRPAKASETLSKGVGSNADINLLLIQSLNDVGLVAAPVVLRTRDQGQLPVNFPSLRKLSTFVVGIVTDAGKNIYIDASSRNGYLNVLPENLLVERARLILKNNRSLWVNLQQVSKSQKSTIINAVLKPNGELKGKQTVRYEGLANMKFRQENGIGGFGPDVTDSLEFTLQGEVTDNTISICPFPTPVKENSFRAKKRVLPVEFPSLGMNRVVVNITLPEGYTLQGDPKNTTIVSPDKGVEGRYQITTSPGKVMLSCQFSINKTLHSEKSYNDLKQIFDLFSQYNTEPLVFKKVQ